MTQPGLAARTPSKATPSSRGCGPACISTHCWSRGVRQAIQDEIIALSEEYHIITPYTSLLVLESDADRERFQVKRRFQMRDGERFFATGRDNVNYELMQQQMRRAGDWRIQLRMAVLRELSALGREPGGLQTARRAWNRRAGVGGYLGEGVVGLEFHSDGSLPASCPLPQFLEASLAIGGSAESMFDTSGGAMAYPVLNRLTLDDVLDVTTLRESERQLRPSDLFAQPEPEPVAGQSVQLWDEYDGKESYAGDLASTSQVFDRDEEYLGTRVYGVDLDVGLMPESASSRKRSASPAGGSAPSFGEFVGGKPARPRSPNWLGALFPYLPPAATEKPVKESETLWPVEAHALAESLLRTKQLAASEGMEIVRDTRYFDPRWGNLTSHQQSIGLISPRSWLVRTGAAGEQTLVQACDEKHRSVFSRAFQLGRLRSATADDLNTPPLDLSGYVLSTMEQAYREYPVVVQPQDENTTLMILHHPTNENYEIHLLIDTQRHVLLRSETRQEGVLTAQQKFEGFVQMAGAWWATQVTSYDGQGRRSVLITQQFKEWDQADFSRRVQEEQAQRQDVQFLQEPLAKTVDAHKRIEDGQGEFADHVVMLLHFSAIQQWDRVLEHLQALEKLADEKPGLRWLRDAVLNDTRRREELKQRVMEVAAQLAQPPADAVASEEYFLVKYLVAQAAGFLEANEMLTLLDLLKPAYDRQATHLEAMKQWNQQQADYLQRSGQNDKALALKKALAADHPHDADIQRQYALALVDVKEYADAKAWIDTVVTKDAQWNAYEAESLRNVITQTYRNQGEYSELMNYLAAWVAENPENVTAYQQYLSALIKNDEVETADGLMREWLEAGLKPGRLSPDVNARLQAAVQQMLGQGYDLYTDRIDEQWLEPLAEIVLFFARQESRNPVADQIMSRHTFTQTDPCRRVRKEVAVLLTDHIETISIDHVETFVNWISPNDPEVEKRLWAKVADALRKRWQAEEKPQKKHRVGQLLARLLAVQINTEDYLAFLREQLSDGPARYRTTYASMLFHALLSQAWTQEGEDEAFTLLKQLSDSDDPDEQLRAQAVGLYRLTDTMVQARFQVLMKEVANQSELSRTNLREKQSDNLRRARHDYARRLAQRTDSARESLVPWISAEWVYLQTVLGEKLDEVEQRCWDFLGPEPVKLDTADNPSDALQDVLRRRYVITLANLAARRGAKVELAERLLAYVNRAAESDPENSARWKLQKYQLLVALDRADELAGVLREWIAVDDAMAGQWRLSLGYLLAEQGELSEAIELFEKLQSADLLGASNLRSLADWYMVLGAQTSTNRHSLRRLK